MGALTITERASGKIASLSTVRCTLGKADRPYPELHGDRQWTMAFVRRGFFEYRPACSARKQALRPGWLLVGAPGSEYECSHEHDGGDDCVSLAVDREVFDDVASNAGVRCDRATPPVLPPAPRISALVEAALRADSMDVDELAYLVVEALRTHVTAAPLPDVAPHPPHIDRVHDAMSRIETSLGDRISLSDLAEGAGFSPFHFLRVFRRVSGMTPHQYLLGARLREAVQMLLDTERSVTDIAYEVGFQDLSNFVRTFHRVVGRSPRAYRRAARSTRGVG